MQKYVREDGTLCEAIQFKGFTEGSDHAFEVVELLNKAELGAFWVAEIVDETEYVEVEDDEGDMVFAPKVHPEKIWMEACKDQLWVNDYVVIRDGDTYTVSGDIFEAIWSLAITDDPSEWEWVLNERLPYSKEVGFWRNKANSDILSFDDGMTYFFASERPPYNVHGQLYLSIKVAK